MKITQIIEDIKNYYSDTWLGEKILPETTRDRILYGNADQECIGIVISCWASTNVIMQAIAKKANFIIVHESMFYNHGDRIEWLEDNKNQTYLEKIKLLKENNIVVWRNHDYIHAGMPMDDGSYADGIFYGLTQKLGWNAYLVGDKQIPFRYEIPPMKAKNLASYIVEKLGLNGVRVMGYPDAMVSKIKIPLHILGDAKNEIIEANEGVDCFLCMELVDFTLSEYIIDSGQLGQDKSLISIGHFNLEEPGMEYMLTYLPKIIKEYVPMSFVKSTDMFEFIIKKELY